ncbi:hypothetical protein M8494_36495 [Serratia ureilytica]
MSPQPVWRGPETSKKFGASISLVFTVRLFSGKCTGAETTASVFGRELHSYVITDAIRDEKVLKFKVDYNDVRPQFKSLETETDEKNSARLKTNRPFCTPCVSRK